MYNKTKSLLLLAFLSINLSCADCGEEKGSDAGRSDAFRSACAADCRDNATGSARCIDGACVWQCHEGYGNCDESVAGCETDLSATVEHCGACADPCPQPPHSDVACTFGECSADCSQGHDDCDDSIDGCETNLLTPTNCGACGETCEVGQICSEQGCVDDCPAGQSICGGSCVNTKTSMEHCGGCSEGCVGVDDKIAECIEGVCILLCPDGLADCSSDVPGCETDITISAGHCGACHQACPDDENSIALCAERACGFRCKDNFADCSEEVDGCETNLMTATQNCGECGIDCTAAANADASCVDGRCAFECLEGFDNCDTLAETGCEADLSSPVTCGSCDHRCESRPGTLAGCALGQCVYECLENFANCNDDMRDGCEANLLTTETCGSCNPCIDRSSVNVVASCPGRFCVYQCVEGWGDCNGDPEDGCETSLNSLNNCGECGNACVPAGMRQSGSCVQGECEYTCQGNWADCDQDPGTGCEANLNTDMRNCTACGNSCEGFANAEAACDVGCSFVCNFGYADCNEDPEDGCETIPALSEEHCGACDNDCTALSSVARVSCAVDHCVIDSCAGDYADCNGDVEDGCEVNLASDAANCGLCEAACAEGLACAEARCECPVGLVDCAGSIGASDCRDLDNDPLSCGDCQVQCDPGQECVAGECQCPDGLLPCTGPGAFGVCVDIQSNAFHCGDCGFICAAQDAGETHYRCAEGSCVNSCPAGTTDCMDGCVADADFLSNPLHCGGCDNMCGVGEWCVAGECVRFQLAGGCSTCPCEITHCPEELSQCCEYPDPERSDLRVCMESCL